MNKIILGLLIVHTFFFVLGCSHKPESPAEAFIENYYQYIESQTFDKAAAAYHESFANNMPKPKRIEKLQKMHQQLGGFKSKRLLSWTTHTQKGSGLEGNYYIFNYLNNYQNAPKVEETFIVLEPQSGHHAIMSHNVNADLFNQDPLSPE